MDYTVIRHWNLPRFVARRKRNGIGSDTGTIRAQS
jgi:hypothetical protein